MKRSMKLGTLTAFALVVVLGLSGCPGKQRVADQPYGRSGVEGAKLDTDPNLAPVYFAHDKFKIP